MVLLGIIGEFLAVIVLIVAITLQIHNNADLGNILVSGGAVLFAIFTKIKLLGYEWDDLHKQRSKGRGRR